MDRATADGVELRYEVRGSGPPVLLVHGAVIAGAMRPLLDQPALEPFRLIRYDRRGYAGSSRRGAPTSMSDQVRDTIGLLDHLGIGRASVVGHSLGANIALDVAATHPERVDALALLEPVFPAAPAGAALLEWLPPIVERYTAGDPGGAVSDFMTLVGRPDWRDRVERAVPGAVAQAEQDAPTFFESDLPAAAQWAFGPDRAAAVRCPVLSVLGTASGPLFEEGRELLHQWLPQCEDADVEGATHMLQVEAAAPVAQAIAAFLGRHAGTSRSPRYARRTTSLRRTSAVDPSATIVPKSST